MELEIRPTTVGATDVDLNDLQDEDILAVRRRMDTLSMTLLRSPISTDSETPLLKIDYTNKYLIESFNWFVREGLASIFENKQLVIPKVGIVKITGYRLDIPRAEDLDQRDKPLWPYEAELGKGDYTGALIVQAEVTWDTKETVKRGTEAIIDLQLGKIPVMVGSAFCNLASIRSMEELVGTAHECPTDYLGYFIINGLKKVLIAQNYLKPNHMLVIMSKMGSTQYMKTVCSVRSKGSDGTMSMHKTFVMSDAVDKVKHSDRRLYMQMEWTTKNAYDKSTTIIGVNVLTIFRLAVILTKINNPLGPLDNYFFATRRADDAQGVQARPAGFFYEVREGEIPDPNDPQHLRYFSRQGYRYIKGFSSTFGEAAWYYETYLREYAGEKLWAIIQTYIADTFNEASLEEDEQTFWRRTIEVNGKVIEDNPLEAFATPLLEDFAAKFMPHLLTSTYGILKRELDRLRQVVREEIHQMHLQRGDETLTAEQFQVAAIDQSLEWLRRLIDIKELNIPGAAEAEAYLLNTRGIFVSANYHRAMETYDGFRREMEAKMKLVANTCIKILRVEMGIDVVDNRDSLAHQMYEDPGILMTSRFASMFRQIERDLAKEVSTPDAGTIKSKLEKYGEKIITSEYASNFSKGTWNARKADKTRTGVTDNLPSSVTTAKLAFLRRLSAQSKGHSKNTTSRELDGLQIGGICLSETPEGQQCGNVEHLATAAFITNESSDTDTLAYNLLKLKSSRRRLSTVEITKLLSKQVLANELLAAKMANGTDYISERRRQDRTTPLLLNGRPMGWVDGLAFRRWLIQRRREGFIHPHTGIHYTQKMSRVGPITQLSIETTGGRIVQPLIVAEDPQRTVNMLFSLLNQSPDQRQMTISDLVSLGFVEFIDSSELEFLDLAPSVTEYLSSIQDKMAERYSHIMLNPAFMMGISANIMPFANMNPVVRNSYFTQMVKQPLDVPKPTVNERAYTSVSRLLSAQRPLVKTDITTSLLPDEHYGTNVQVLIRPHREGEEDGIVVNRRWLDMGGLSAIKYASFPVSLKQGQELDFGKDFMETESDPDRYGRGIIRVKRRITTQNPDGTVTISEEPVVVKPNEILARKTWKKDDQQAFEDVSHDSLRYGIVDRIMWSKSVGSTRTAYIIIRMPDDLWLGDKITSRYSQKGVVAAVVNDEDMPFNAETGRTADIILNPQAFPSRMTVGMLAEMLVGNAHVSPDKNKTVFMLYQSKGFDIFAPLERVFVVDAQAWKDFNYGGSKVNQEVAPSPDGKPDIPVSMTNEPAKVSSGRRTLTTGRAPGGLLGGDPHYELGQEPLSPTFNRAQLLNQMIPEAFQTQTSSLNNARLVMVSSEEATSQDQMEWLKANDQAVKIPAYSTGLWVIRFYGDRVTPGGSGRRQFTGVSSERHYMTVFSPSLNQELQTLHPDQFARELEMMHVLLRRTGGLERMAFNIMMASENVEIIEGLWFDVERNEDGNFVNPMRGIRVSNLPNDDLAVENNPFSRVGQNLREIYLRGNIYTPVATQAIADYRPNFFNRINLANYYYNFVIPPNMTVVNKIQLPGQSGASNWTMPQGTTYIDLQREESKIKQTITVDAVDSNGIKIEKLEDIETTILEAWKKQYGGSQFNIPREYVIDLPVKARDVYGNRRDKIRELRESASLFKAGNDLNDAMKELDMMGYSPDMKSQFISGITGEPIEGGIVSAWSYYMPLKHKVKYKMQARGFGKRDPRTKQPNQGRNKVGGLRFNYMDALASIKSGAAAFVSDRLLDSSSRQDVFICKDCRDICYREGEEGGVMGAIICPLCKNETGVIRISIPYSFILMRNQAMAAGVRLKIEAALDDDQDE
jgi:DNA-directed RNA polymerase beta subunit